MLNIGWGEMAVIAVVTLIVVGPKELPNVLRTGAHWMRQVRKMSREFQSGVDSLVREAELDEAKKIVTSVKQGTIGRQIEKAVDPTGEISKSLDPKQIVREADAATKPATSTAVPKPVSTGTTTPASTTPAAPSPATDPDASVGAKSAAVVIGPASVATPERPAAPAEPAPAAPDAVPAAAAEPDPARKTGS